MLFGIYPCTSRTPKFWQTYVITYGNFIVIVQSWMKRLFIFFPCNSKMPKIRVSNPGFGMLMTVLAILSFLYFLSKYKNKYNNTGKPERDLRIKVKPASRLKTKPKTKAEAAAYTKDIKAKKHQIGETVK